MNMIITDEHYKRNRRTNKCVCVSRMVLEVILHLQYLISTIVAAPTGFVYVQVLWSGSSASYTNVAFSNEALFQHTIVGRPNWANSFIIICQIDWLAVQSTTVLTLQDSTVNTRPPSSLKHSKATWCYTPIYIISSQYKANHNSVDGVIIQLAENILIRNERQWISIHMWLTNLTCRLKCLPDHTYMSM